MKTSFVPSLRRSLDCVPRALGAIAIVATTLLGQVTSTFAEPVALPEGAPAYVLPLAFQDRLALGIASHLNTPGTGATPVDTDVRWDFRYQYLAGGLGSGWSSWVPNGAFPIGVARDMARDGAMPVFTYYQLLGADAPCSPCDEKQRNIAQLNDPALMARYYADFALLMRRLGSETHDGIMGFGQPVVVHVEPDLSGFVMQALRNRQGCLTHCIGAADDPAGLSASVASTGIADLADLPNTYQGFSWAFLRLRDLYAPNVMLGFHISNWATNSDIGSSTDRALDADHLGEVVGRFAAKSGASQVSQMPAKLSTYDLLFNDPADRDSGYMKVQSGKPTYWWDRLNLAAPNFARWERYIGAAVRATSRPAIAWQIPVGNQVFRSMNNTNGHYQDNKVEYFLSHVDELRAAGIVGLMFARGGGSGNASVFDDVRDGVTNPAPVCTTDGISQGSICNDREAISAEDDGGFLRLAAQQYYTSGFRPVTDALLTASIQPAETAIAITNRPTEPYWSTTALTGASMPTVRAGGSVAIPVIAGAQRDATVTVKLELRSASNALVHEASFERVALTAGVERDFVTTWNVPAGTSAGEYTIKLGVYSPDWKTLHSWNNSAASLAVAQA